MDPTRRFASGHLIFEEELHQEMPDQEPKPQRKDKPTIAALVVIVAALLTSQGVEVSDEEQQKLIEAAGMMVAGVATLVLAVRGAMLKFRSMRAGDSEEQQ